MGGVFDTFENGSRRVHSKNIDGWQCLGSWSNPKWNCSNYPKIKNNERKTPWKHPSFSFLNKL